MSAVVLIPLVAIAIYLGGLAIALAVSAMLAGAYREWEGMLTGGRHDWRGRMITGLLALGPVGYAAGGFYTGLLLLAVTVLLIIVAVDGDGRYRLRVPGAAFLGFVGLALLSIRGSGRVTFDNLILSGHAADGVWVGVFLAAIIWLTDSGAFFTGRMVGGERLAPDISPSKTWSGAIGGLVIGTLGGLIVWLLATRSPVAIGLIISAMVSVLAQVGDLAESAVKRRFMVKDSGDLIPGHGGILDRIDSFTVAGIGLFIIGAAHAGIDSVAQGVLDW